MSMLGGIQPGRLRSYLVNALEDGPSNDGLLQRFQLLVWPDTPVDWHYLDRKPNAACAEIAVAENRPTDRPRQRRPERGDASAGWLAAGVSGIRCAERTIDAASDAVRPR